MKRGFLLKAAAKKAAADRRNRQLQASESGSSQSRPQQTETEPPLPTSTVEDLPEVVRLRYGNLTEQEKALPEDYDKSSKKTVMVELDPARTDFIPGGILFTTMPHVDDGDGSTEWIIKGANAKEKVVKTPGYPARIPKPRPNLYEVRVTPDMGQGVFAKRNIKCGELIFSERPLILAPNWLGGEPSDLSNQYTLRQVQQVLVFEFEKVLDVAVKRMDEEDKAVFMSLHNSHTADGSGPLLGIMRTNAFGAGSFSDSDDLKQYGGVCNIGSRVNHSCMPNVNPKFKIQPFSYQFLATRDIKAGEQLFSTYCQPDRTKAERQTDLAPYGFSCSCPTCANATPATDELRKTFIERIARLRSQVDLDQSLAGCRDGILPSALLLEKEMVAEGLESANEFFALVCILLVISRRLGKWVEMAKYQNRLKGYYRAQCNDESFQTWLEEAGLAPSA